MVKNIVVIGASYSGHGVANVLASQLPEGYRVLLVERNEFTLHVPTVVRATVVPGWEEKNLTARLTQDVVFPADSRHRVICPNAVVELRKSSVVLERPFEGSTEVFFEKCVIATGAQQPEPMRPRPGATVDEYKATLRNIQADIKAASSILVVGGGTAGVEVAGEISSLYPDKKLTLIHNDWGLLHPTPPSSRPGTPGTPPTYAPAPTEPKMGNSLTTQLRARGVKVLLNDRAVVTTAGPLGGLQKINTTGGHVIKADYVFMSVGNRPNSALVADVDKGALTTNGYVLVDDVFRVVPGSPDSPLAGQYYALGDVSATKSWKTCVSAVAEAAALGGILVAQAKGKKPKKYSAPAVGPVVVTLGTKGGAGAMPVPLFGSVGLPGMVIGMKNKDFFAGQSFYSRFRGAHKVPVSA